MPARPQGPMSPRLYMGVPTLHKMPSGQDGPRRYNPVTVRALNQISHMWHRAIKLSFWFIVFIMSGNIAIKRHPYSHASNHKNICKHYAVHVPSTATNYVILDDVGTHNCHMACNTNCCACQRQCSAYDVTIMTIQLQLYLCCVGSFAHARIQLSPPLCYKMEMKSNQKWFKI